MFVTEHSIGYLNFHTSLVRDWGVNSKLVFPCPNLKNKKEHWLVTLTEGEEKKAQNHQRSGDSHRDSEELCW